MRFLHLSLATALILVVGLTAQQSAVSLNIVSPTSDSYVSEAVVLRAIIEPAERTDAVARVTFFADGTQVCEIERPPFECAWDAGPRVTEHLVRAVAILRDGQRLVANVRTRKLGYTEQVDVDVVQVTVTVAGGGRFVRGLTRSDFRVSENDAPQTISHFAAENIPLEIVVAVDVSSSMARVMPRLKLAVKQFLSALRPRDQVTLVAFNDNIVPLVRRGSDPAARIRAVDRLAPWGGTALYDVVSRSLDMLGRQQGRRALVVFSDGDDTASHITFETALRRVESSDATVYAIGQGRGAEQDSLKRVLQRLAELSGGRALFTNHIDELEGAFAQILEELSNQYLISYAPTNMKRDGSWRRIRVELKDSRHRVRARQGYRAPRGSG